MSVKTKKDRQQQIEKIARARDHHNNELSRLIPRPQQKQLQNQKYKHLLSQEIIKYKQPKITKFTTAKPSQTESTTTTTLQKQQEQPTEPRKRNYNNTQQ